MMMRNGRYVVGLSVVEGRVRLSEGYFPSMPPFFSVKTRAQ